LPVFIGIAFTLLHALVQAYVLTMLVSIFYGEATEVHEKKEKVKKVKKNKKELISEV
jgi:F-type H+-transporting ATPase subunit a